MKFALGNSILIKVRSINHIITSEQSKAKFVYQEALTATVSHEQMTPLNSILNLTELLISSTTDNIEQARSEDKLRWQFQLQ